MRLPYRTAVAVAALMAGATPAAAETVFGLTTNSTIVTFDSATPGTIRSTGSISGLASGDVLTGIDFRPADSQLYAIGTSGNVYRLTTGAGGSAFTATNLGALSTAPSGSSFGIDFNPTVDRLRFVSDTNQNLRINTISPPGTIVDTALTLNGSTSIDVIGSAYTNSVFGATGTTLYGLDAFTDALVRSTNANGGLYTNTNLSGQLFGPLGVTFSSTDLLGFDISGFSGAGFFSLNNGFFGVDLNTGAATRIGTVGSGNLIGISVAPVPEPGTWAMMLIGFGAVGAAMRRRRQTARAAFA
jgi:hypothetical protein